MKLESFPDRVRACTSGKLAELDSLHGMSFDLISGKQSKRKSPESRHIFADVSTTVVFSSIVSLGGFNMNGLTL